jgi:hypothetical protein
LFCLFLDLLSFEQFDFFRQIKFVGRGVGTKAEYGISFDDANNATQQLTVEQDLKEWEGGLKFELGGDSDASFAVSKGVSGMDLEIGGQMK